MNVDAWVRFFVEHSGQLAVLTFAIIMAIATLVYLRSLLRGEGGVAPADGQLKDLEVTLQRVIAQANEAAAASVPRSRASASDATDSDATGYQGSASEHIDGGAMAAELARAKKKLEEKLAAQSQEINLLKTELAEKDQALENATVAPATNDSGGESLDELKDKVKALEAKLFEYEIIEDDIADLSQFKEENRRLKEELDRLKSGAGGVGSASEAAAVTEAEIAAGATKTEAAQSIATEAITEALSAEAATEALSAEATTEALSAEEPAAAAAMPEEPNVKLDATVSDVAELTESLESEPADNGSVSPAESSDDQEMLDLASLVADVGNSLNEMNATVSAPTTPQVVVEKTQATTPPPDEGDLFSEFAAPIEVSESARDAAAAKEPSEMDLLQDVVAEFSKAVGHEEILNEDLDTDKMLKEATDLEPLESAAVDLEGEADFEKMVSEASELVTEAKG